jgi:hypothetical protein
MRCKQVKSSFRFVVAAVALGFLANANAAVIVQSTTQITKHKVLVQYQRAPGGVLQSLKIKPKRLARWCRRHGGCTYALVGGNNTILAAVSDGGDPQTTDSVPVPVPEPATLMLLGAGLLGMGLGTRRRGVAT